MGNLGNLIGGNLIVKNLISDNYSTLNRLFPETIQGCETCQDESAGRLPTKLCQLKGLAAFRVQGSGWKGISKNVLGLCRNWLWGFWRGVWQQLWTVRGCLVEWLVIEEEINQGGFGWSHCREEYRHRRLVEYKGQQLVWLSCAWSPQLIPVLLKSDFWPPSVCLVLCFTAVGVSAAGSSRGFYVLVLGQGSRLLLDRLGLWCQQWVWSV